MPSVPLAFHPGDASFNHTNALYLAHASDVAYIRTPEALALERLGLTASRFHSKLTRVRGFVGICDSHAVLSFRGSEQLTLPSWITDSVVRLVACDDYEGGVHLGFSSVLQHCWERIERLLEVTRDRPLFLTGHSMGGALAVLTAYRLTRQGRPPVGVYTFGSPKVGNAVFCASCAFPIYRVVNRLDLVPELPLASLERLIRAQPGSYNAWSMLFGEADPATAYHHLKTLVYIDHDGAITLDAEIAPWHADAIAVSIATLGTSFFQGVTDHLITNYILGLAGQAQVRHAVRRRRAAIPFALP